MFRPQRSAKKSSMERRSEEELAEIGAAATVDGGGGARHVPQRAETVHREVTLALRTELRDLTPSFLSSESMASAPSSSPSVSLSANFFPPFELLRIIEREKLMKMATVVRTGGKVSVRSYDMVVVGAPAAEHDGN